MGGCPASVKSTAFSFFIGLSSPLDGEKKKSLNALAYGSHQILNWSRSEKNVNLVLC